MGSEKNLFLAHILKYINDMAFKLDASVPLARRGLFGRHAIGNLLDDLRYITERCVTAVYNAMSRIMQRWLSSRGVLYPEVHGNGSEVGSL